VDFFNVLKERHSVRLFQARPVEAEKLQAILEAINRAPSAGNLQAYEVYLVQQAERRADLVRGAGDQEFLAQAPIVLVFCAHPMRAETRYRERGSELYCIQDATIACTFAMLAATALGLSSVWVGAFDEEAVRGIIGAPRDQRPVAMLPVGYAAESPRIRERRSLEEMVHEV
jgi:nitroreductase